MEGMALLLAQLPKQESIIQLFAAIVKATCRY
jgi:hypothetical protein